MPSYAWHLICDETRHKPQMKWGESEWLISIHNTMSICWSANQSDPRESQGSGLVLSACRSMWWAAQAKTSMLNPSTSTRKPRNWICPKLKISENINKAKYRERHKSGKRDSFKSTRKFDTKYRNVAQKAEQDMAKGHSINSKESLAYLWVQHICCLLLRIFVLWVHLLFYEICSGMPFVDNFDSEIW